MSPTVIECGSWIERVVVYARGAVVTRRVSLPDALPHGPVELWVSGLTARADAGSVRTLCDGDREVTAQQVRLTLPGERSPRGALSERVRALDLQRERLEAEQRSLAELRAALAGARLDPGLSRWAKRLAPEARFGDAAAVSGLLDGELARLDAQLHALSEALREDRHERRAAVLAEAQGRPDETDGARAALQVRLRLAGGEGEVRALQVEYMVGAARWWPAYSARFSAAATKVSLTLDAFVAQATGEDWSRVSLALSTAHPALDARLPELRSLRFGRAQPPVKRGYRPAPEGLDALFEGYDRAALPPPPVAEPPPLPVVERLPTEAGVITLPAAAPFISSKEEVDEAPSKKAKPRAATPSAPAQVMAALGARLAKGEDARSEAAKMAVDGLPADAPMEPAVCAGVEPGDDWLDFDALVLDDPADRAHRGRLTRGARPQGELDAREAARVIEELEAPAFARDPPAVRGRFDHRYDARGTVDVPASARPHRVTVGVAEGSATPRFIAVPREAAEVYREAEIKNPFDAPLLAGPVDVFLDGALMTTSELGLVDKGGVLHIGLGVEDRLRVARNARVEESTIGLLGGSLQVDHTVTVDLASSLGREVKVKVLERVPVTDDKDVEVKLLYARPEAEPYTQAERGAPVRRGLAFSVDVPAGENAKLELSYRVTLPAKNEIVGGNRRD